MKVLVTGASGFVGGWLARTLAARFEVLAPRRAELDLTDGASVDRWFAEHAVDAVVHSAVRGGEIVLEDTLRMHAHLDRHRARFGTYVYFGSGAELDKSRDIARAPESAFGERVPKDRYGLAKYVCNAHARAAHDRLNLRLFGVYGPGEKYLYTFISNAIVRALVGLPIRVRQDVRFSYLWVGDLTAIVARCLSAPLDATDLNVVPDEVVSLSQIVDVVLRETAATTDVSFATPGLNFEYSADNARLRALVPDVAFTSLDDGIRQLVAYYREHLDQLDVEALRRDDYGAKIVVRATT